MMLIFDRFLAQLQILFLLVVSSPRLFNRINKLPWYKGYLTDWHHTLALKPNSKILEIGCATGVFTQQLSSMGAVPTGVDRSESMVALAKKQFPELKFVINKKSELPFEATQFDAVIGASLLNVVDDPLQFINQAKYVCKTGGKLSFLLPHPDFDRKKGEEIIQLLNLSGFSAAALSTWQRASKKISPITVVDLFNKAGLANPEVELLFHGAIYCVSAKK